MLDLNTKIKEALRKGKSKIHIKGQEYTLNDAIKMNTYMNGGYKMYNDGGGKKQKKNKHDLYGNVTPEKLNETKKNNPWYDWNSFDGSEEAIRDFQKTYNELTTEGGRIEVDGKFGERTQAVRLEQRPQLQSVNSLEPSLNPEIDMGLKTPDGMWLPKVGGWNVTESVVNPYGFGSHTRKYKTNDQAKIDDRKRSFEIDQSTHTGKNNSIQIEPIYTGTKVYEEFSGGGYKKYNNGGDPPNDLFSTQNPFLQNPSVFGVQAMEHEQMNPNSSLETTPANTSQLQPQQRPKVQYANALGETPGIQTQGEIKGGVAPYSEMTPDAFLQTGNTNKLSNQYGLGQEPKDPKVETEEKVTGMRTFNPYAGVDIPSAAAFLGQGIEKGGWGGVGMATAAGAKLGLGVARNILGGMGRERTIQDQMKAYNQQQKDNMEGQPRYSASQENGGYFEMGGIMPAPMQAAYDGYNYREDGGEIPEERVLTGEFMQGVSPNNQSVQPNSELEDGEHIHSQDGSSIKVEGKTHEQGGEEMELQEGDRVISNNLKLKGDGAKKLKQDFDVKVKAKDTYASAVDKIYKSIGLSKIIKEEEEVLGKLKKIEEDVKDETTRNLNSEFLYKKLKDIQSKKEELEPLRQQALETVFNLQEASKPKEETEDELMFEDGGLKVISERYNIPIERAKEILEEYKNGGYKKYEDGGEKERFNKWVEQLRELGYEKEYDPNRPYKEQITEVQQWVAKNKPEAVLEYFQEQPITSKGLKQIKETAPEIFESLGIKAPENIAQLSAEDRKKVQNAYKEKVDDSQYNDFIIDQFQDNLFDFRAPLFELEDKQPEEPKEEPAPQDKEVVEKNMLDIPLTPDQGVIPPSGMASQLNVQRRYDRVDPRTMSADAIVEENNRQAKAAIDATADLPPSQRAAAIGQINSQLQQQNSQAISQVEMQNAQILNQAESQNAQIQGREEDMRATDALSYEQRQQTAQALTEENVRQFYDYLRKTNNARFNETVTRNALNQYDENFSIDSLGNVIKTGEAPTAEDWKQSRDKGALSYILPQQQAQQRYGGKYKNKK